MNHLDAESRPCDQNQSHLTDLTPLLGRKEELRTRRRAENREGSFAISVQWSMCGSKVLSEMKAEGLGTCCGWEMIPRQMRKGEGLW